MMKTLIFSSRTLKEIIRDPISLFFGLVFPVILLILLTLINKNIPMNQFDLVNLTPGIAVFGLSFMALFAGQIVAKDRTSEFLNRLFTTPMKAKDFILGYTLPLIPMAFLQMVICFVVALFLGMEFSFSIILTIVLILPIGLVFISSGLLLGSILSEKAVGGICGALLTNVTAWFSGAWFSVELVGGMFEKIAYVLPFYHAVEVGRAAMTGQYADMYPHLWWVLGYSIVISILAVYVFRKKMNL